MDHNDAIREFSPFKYTQIFQANTLSENDKLRKG